MWAGEQAKRTFISEDLRNKLKLPTLKTEQLVINTFGTNESEITQYDSVKFVMKSKDKTFEIETNALVQETICSPLQGQEVKFAKEHYAVLFHVDLADGSPGPQAEINILIGADVMWKILTGEVRRGEKPNEAVALGTHLGYVL